MTTEKQMNWKGRWTSVEKYQIGDVVYFKDNGFAYVCSSENMRGYPPTLKRSGFEVLTENFPITLIDGGQF